MLLDKSIHELALLLKTKKISSEDLVLECYANIEKYNGDINAFITVVDIKKAIEQARRSDIKREKSSSPLSGLPFILKDSYSTTGIRTTAASKILDNYIPQYNATVYQKLLDSGAILVGKTNMDAWGHGASSENTDFGPVKNPWDISRSAGGSTGGVAAALTSRMAVFGIGEDTGGSIRNPSAWCNLSGLKVTYGRVSRYGCIAYASSFDTVGPMAKTAQDCAYILEAIAGNDPYDATSSAVAVEPYVKLLDLKNKPLTLGIPKEMLREGVDDEIKTALLSAAKTFEKLGNVVKEISMPLLDYGIAVYYLIAPSETSSNLGRFDGVRYGRDRAFFTPETVRRIMLGTFALSSGYYDAYYKKALQARTLFINIYNKAFSQCDALLMPVIPMSATKLGQLINDPIKNMLTDVFTTTQNPVGVPSLAIPAGFTAQGLPIGMQLVGPLFKEATILYLGHKYQQNTNWHLENPPLLKTKI